MENDKQQYALQGPAEKLLEGSFLGKRLDELVMDLGLGGLEKLPPQELLTCLSEKLNGISYVWNKVVLINAVKYRYDYDRKTWESDPSLAPLCELFATHLLNEAVAV